MKTNLGKTKEEIILELLISLNQGNTSYNISRVYSAIGQYNTLVKEGIVVEFKEEN